MTTPRRALDSSFGVLDTHHSRAWLALALLLGAAPLAGCDQRGSARAEARALMTSLNAVSDQGTLSSRNAALARLEQLPLEIPEHVQTRNVCRAAHVGLLEAEAAQAEARRALSDANAVEHGQANAIAADIERSNRALAIAKQRFPECEQAMRELLRQAH